MQQQEEENKCYETFIVITVIMEFACLVCFVIAGVNGKQDYQVYCVKTLFSLIGIQVLGGICVSCYANREQRNDNVQQPLIAQQQVNHQQINEQSSRYPVSQISLENSQVKQQQHDNQNVLNIQSQIKNRQSQVHSTIIEAPELQQAASAF